MKGPTKMLTKLCGKKFNSGWLLKDYYWIYVIGIQARLFGRDLCQRNATQRTPMRSLKQRTAIVKSARGNEAVGGLTHSSLLREREVKETQRRRLLRYLALTNFTIQSKDSKARTLGQVYGLLTFFT